MHPHLPADAILLAGAGLLLAGLVGTRLAERLQVPGLLVFLGIGMIIGDDGLAWIRFNDVTFAQTVGVIALVLILFDGGLATPSDTVRSVLGPASLLATVGVGVTASIVGAAAMLVFHLSWSTGLLLGAVVASTDAAAVFAALRSSPVRHRLGALLEVESGGNDPMAVLLTVGLLSASEHAVSPTSWVVFGVRELFGGLLVGAVVGWFAGQVLRRSGDRIGEATLPLLGVGTAAACYGLGALVGASGFLAVYVGGIVFASVEPEASVPLASFLRGLATVAQVGLFILLGILVFPSHLGAVALRALALAAVLMFVARPVAAVTVLPWFGFDRREVAWLSWAGLRGAVPIVLATFPLTEGHPAGELIFDTTFFVVLVSAAVQGTTVMPLARRLGLIRAAATP
jgi:cell volume regulation protein A